MSNEPERFNIISAFKKLHLMPGFGTQPRQRKKSVSRLRHRVALQARVETATDGRGHPEYQWATIEENVPCRIVKLSGREAEIARQLVPQSTHSIELRFDKRVTEQMRFMWEVDCQPTRYFYIGDLDNPDEVGRFLYAIVEESSK